MGGCHIELSAFTFSCLYAVWSLNGHQPLHLSIMSYAPCLLVAAGVAIYIRYFIGEPSLFQNSLMSRLAEAESNEKRNRAIVMALPDMVFVIDRDGHYVDFNESSGQEAIVDPTEFISKKVSDVLPGDLAMEVMTLVQRVLTTRHPIGHHYQLEVRGYMRYFESRYVPHEKNKVMVLVRDMTEAIRAEQRIKESEYTYRTLVEQGTDSIFIANFQGNFLVVNPAGCRLTEYTEAELLRMRFHDVVSEEELKRNPFRLAEIASGQTITSERKMKRRMASLST
jgi:PAS domain S-box-containing protein